MRPFVKCDVNVNLYSTSSNAKMLTPNALSVFSADMKLLMLCSCHSV